MPAFLHRMLLASEGLRGAFVHQLEVKGGVALRAGPAWCGQRRRRCQRQHGRLFVAVVDLRPGTRSIIMRGVPCLTGQVRAHCPVDWHTYVHGSDAGTIHDTWRGRGRKKGRGGGGEHVPSLHRHALDVPAFCRASHRVVEERRGPRARRGAAVHIVKIPSDMWMVVLSVSSRPSST